MSGKREKMIKKKKLGNLLWLATAILLVFYFLKLHEYRNRDVLYILFLVILSGLATFCLPLSRRRGLTLILWLMLFCEFFLRATVYGRESFFEYTIFEADARRVEWFISENVNLVPFRTIRIFEGIMLSDGLISDIRHAFINLAGNVVLLIPCSFLVPFAFPKTRKAFFGSRYILPILFVFCLSLLAELSQLFFMCGDPDVDDLILNTLGGVIGAVCAIPLLRKNK